MHADHLRLSAAAPRPLPAAPSPGTVLGGKGFDTSAPHDVRLALSRPAWLVLAESYSAGWRAWCRSADGRERALGKPQPMVGFGNGWPVTPSCRIVRFAFAAQGGATLAYILSGLGCLLLCLVIVVAAIRSRRRGDHGRGRRGLWVLPEPGVPRQLSVPSALMAAVGAGGLASLLGWQLGIAVGVVFLVLGLAGLSSKRFLLLACAGLVTVPVLYLIHPVLDQGGFNFSYARQHLDAHWVALTSLACVGAAALLEARVTRSCARTGRVARHGGAD